MAILTRASKGSALSHAEMDKNLLSNTSHYGTMSITANATSITVPLAGDQTLADNADYVQVTGVFDAVPVGALNGITQQANTLTIARDGVYQVQLWATVTSDTSNTNIAFRFAVNGVIELVRRPRAKVGSGNDRVNISAHGLVALSAGDVVSLWWAADKASDITLEDGVFSLIELRTT